MNDVQERLKKEHGVRALAIDGFPMSQWVVADYGDVIVHIFHETKRKLYALEDLWSEAPRIRFDS